MELSAEAHETCHRHEKLKALHAAEIEDAKRLKFLLMATVPIQETDCICKIWCHR